MTSRDIPRPSCSPKLARRPKCWRASRRLPASAAQPKTDLRSPTAMWDFWPLSPESLHQVTILMSDRGLPQDMRNMHGFGSHAFSFINAQNQRQWVKFHFKTMQGIKNWTNREAEAVVATDRESAQRDLYDAIARGDFPKWRFYVQIMTEAEAEKTPYN